MIKIKKFKNIKVKSKCVLCTVYNCRREGEKNYEYVILVGYIK